MQIEIQMKRITILLMNIIKIIEKFPELFIRIIAIIVAMVDNAEKISLTR